MAHSDKVLLVGSGLTAKLATDWDLTGWTVCVIHNAWKIVPERWDILLHALDFPEERKPINYDESKQKLVTTYEWVMENFKDETHAGFWRKHTGYGKTMFFSSFWWILETLKPKVVGFVGCDMYYPEVGDNTIYGTGSPDPLKYPRKSLLHWLGFIDGFCVRDNITLMNFSPYGSPTLLPFSHGLFPSETPIERGREHRCESEYWPGGKA